MEGRFPVCKCQSDHTPLVKSKTPSWVLNALGCVFLALTQLLWAGYQFGVGNQSIQIPFAYKLGNPELFSRDTMVTQTLASYPSYFYRLISGWLFIFDLPTLYLGLHIVTATAVALGLVLLCRAMMRDDQGGQAYRGPAVSAGFVLILMTLSGDLRTLGGEGLYSAGFTHTWVAFAIGVFVLALFYGQRYLAAFVLAGLMFNIHALQAAYLGAFMGVTTLMSIRRIGAIRVPTWWVIYALAAGPTLVVMLMHRHEAADIWLQLMRIRSADHSFPSTWWEVGNPDVPRFALLVAMGALGMSLLPRGEHLRKTRWIGLTAGLLFAVGYLLTEVYTVDLIVRAQLLRSSRFIEVIALAYVAGGCARAWAMLLGEAEGRSALWRRLAEVLVMTLGVACIALPGWVVMLPWVVVAAMVVAWVNGRLSWYVAMIVAGAILIVLHAHRTLDLIVPGLSDSFMWATLLDVRLPGVVGLIALGLGVAMWVLSFVRWSGRQRLIPAGLGAVAAATLLMVAWPSLARPGGDQSWLDIQHWARENTPGDALFVTPPRVGGFRVHSQRAVVGEWRDGTQLYFNATFAGPWWERMTSLQPGLVYNADGTRVLKRGQRLDQMDDQQIMALAKTWGANYVVLPTGKMRWMDRVYANERWAIYRPMIPEPTPGEKALAAQRRYIAHTAQADIRKHRTSDTRVQVLDRQGRPIANATYRITQQSSPFRFGATLPPFVVPNDTGTPGDDLQRPPATDTQRQAFREIFNATVTGMTGTWMQIEPTQGQRWYADVDAYLDWCQRHGIAVEYHFLSGYEPTWATLIDVDSTPPNRRRRHRHDRRRPRRLIPQLPLLRLGHVKQVLDRYQDRVAYWQVIDDGVGAYQAKALFDLARRTVPNENLKLGIGACVRFGSDAPPNVREADMWRGLELIRELQEQGVQVDFVSFHAHRPWGYWADVRMIQQTIEAYAELGVRVHVTQVAQPNHGPITGPIVHGQWTPELQAEYYKTVLTACFANPNVDLINVESLATPTLTAGAALLDENDQPTPAYHALHKLIREAWRTNESGTLGLDGAVRLAAFHGRYELAIETADGQNATTTFTVTPSESSTHRFTFADGTLTPEGQP